jgi:MoxR-like ATPase
VVPDDVKQFAHDALGHRIILEPSLWGSKTVENTVLDEVLQSVSVPVIPVEHE